MKSLRFFIKSLEMRFNEQSAYKLNFILRILTLLSFDLMLPFITIMIYLQSKGFRAWSFNEILMFQGMFIMVNSVDRMFFQRVDWSLTQAVRTGYFDRYLLFPVNTLQYISFTNFSLEQIVNFFIGLGLFIYSFIRLDFVPAPIDIAVFSGCFVLALIFIYSVAILKYSLIVRAVRIGRLREFLRTVKDYGRYPVDIYGSIMSSFFRYVIPLAVLSYYPTSALIREPSENFLIVMIVILMIYFFSRFFWKNTLEQYTSAGG
ncbi:hypothetical protein GF327_08285 [Candidatus Woesearchaeota archaeon]|nr:hypothetical protein [Candidatus Woesearchaeota archaeon]